MNKAKILFIFLLTPFLLFGCGSTKRVKKDVPSRFAGLTLAKDVEKKGTLGIPLEQGTLFSTQDKEVIAHLKFEDLSSNTILRWDWYDPGGNLYYTTRDYPIEISRGRYRRETTAWHRLAIQGDKAGTLPGEWVVKVYMNNELLESKNFILKALIDIEEFPETAQKPFPKDWGLVIGIEDYASLPSVDYARRDAFVVKEYFIRVLGVPEENVVVLLDNNATKARIQGFVKQYLPTNIEKDGTLYVYYAGHGAPDMEKGEPYIVPYDGDTRFIEQTGIRLKALYEDLDQLQIQRAYIFLDSCFSGVASRAEEMLTEGARPALVHVEDVKLESDELISLSAANAGQISNSYPETQHGLFTYYLLKGLGGEADANDDNLISVKEAFAYVKTHVVRVSRRMGKEQTPVITPSLDEIKDLAITRPLK